jgi:hypothetical protein
MSHIRYHASLARLADLRRDAAASGSQVYAEKLGLPVPKDASGPHRLQRSVLRVSSVAHSERLEVQSATQ